MTEVLKISPEAQQTLMQMQTFQQQMQTMSYQKETLKFQKIEAERALDELKKLKDKDEIFKAVGPILVKTKKADIEAELKEKMETSDVRMKAIEKQEDKIKDKLEEIQKKLEVLLKDEQKADAN